MTFRGTSLAILTFHENGQVTHGDPRLLALLGKGPTSTSDWNFFDALRPGQKSRVINEIIQGRHGFSIDLDVQGAQKTLEVAGVGVDASGCYSLWMDVSERKVDEHEGASAMRRQTSQLLEVARNPVLDSGDLDASFRLLTAAASAGLQGARASIWLYTDSETKIFCEDIYISETREHSRGAVLSAGDFPGYFVALAEDRAISADDAHRHPATREFSECYLKPLGITSMLEAPIRIAGKLVGVLCNEHIGPARTYTAQDLTFASALGDLAGRALQAAARHQADMQLRQAHEALEAHARELEDRVRERTRDLRLVLDNAGNGFVTISLDGTILGEPSACARTWFPTAVAGAPGSMLFDSRGEALFTMGLEAMRDDFLPFEIIADQMPKERLLGSTWLGYRYRPVIDQNGLACIVVVIADISDEKRAMIAMRESRELQAVVRQVMADGQGFRSSLHESERLVREIAVGSRDSQLRALHTLKGNAALMGFESVATACHHAEEAMSDGDEGLASAALTQVAKEWADTTRRIAPLISGRSDGVFVRTSEIAQLVRQSAGTNAAPLVANLTESWTRPELRPSLDRLARQAERLADQLNRRIRVEIEDHVGRLPRQDLEPLFAAMIHLIRNAVDHGIESPSERIRGGKGEVATLRFVATMNDDHLSICVADDGRGIDWERVASKARALGLPAENHDQLRKALFSSRFSTREVVSDISGRGVGLDALASVVEGLGGELTLSTELGKGTSFAIRVPGNAQVLSKAA
jgi:GAF domain-containing protein/HPt (histidine-containing phosphotransfer) domain-containing protein